VESVDTPDLKSVGLCPWEFKSPSPYLINKSKYF